MFDPKNADAALKALKEITKMLGIGVKETATGEGTLEELILQSLQKREVKVIEAEVVEVDE